MTIRFTDHLTCIALTISILSAATAQAEDAKFGYKKDGKTVVVQMSYTGGMIANPDTTPFLRVYGDGTVLVHRPKYHKAGGDYAFKLTDQELTALLTSMADNGVLAFNAQEVQRLKKEDLKRRQDAARKAGGAMMLSRVMDAATTVVEVKLDSYTPAGKPGEKLSNVNKKVSWYAIRHDAQQFPTIKPIQGLSTAVGKLQALCRSDKLKKR